MSQTKTFDLEERTAKFGESIIKFCKDLAPSPINNPLVNQIIRSATSIGANYMEANGASSKADFTNKIFLCKKESQETKHWLRMIRSCNLEKDEEIQLLWKECQELVLIFQKITSSLRGKSSV